jgi:hypothetical protein
MGVGRRGRTVGTSVHYMDLAPSDVVGQARRSARHLVDSIKCAAACGVAFISGVHVAAHIE